jgi:hypothetical protein
VQHVPLFTDQLAREMLRKVSEKTHSSAKDPRVMRNTHLFIRVESPANFSLISVFHFWAQFSFFSAKGGADRSRRFSESLENVTIGGADSARR